MKLTELVKQWREEAIRASDEDRYEAVAIIRDCTDQLEAYIADNEWVQITDDESTWPEEYETVMFFDARRKRSLALGEITKRNDGNFWTVDGVSKHDFVYPDHVPTHYRPLNDNDSPPINISNTDSKED